MNLKNIRKKKQITQLKLANSLDVDQSTVSKWEKGKSLPNLTTTKKLAEVLDCKIEDLI